MLFADKLVSAQKAVSAIRNGQTVFIGTGSGEPVLLTEALAQMAGKIWDVKIIHLMAQRTSSLANPEYFNSFRYNTFYIGSGMADAVSSGAIDFTPMNVSELPTAMARGITSIDVAMIQVSPPSATGLCSLGISVDATKAAVESAKVVIAQVNENMPLTMGDSIVSVDSIDSLVEGTSPLIEVSSPELDAISLTIGRHIARLIRDGMTLHFDRGVISAATMRYLDAKRDLGIHTEIITDDIMRLIKTGAVTNRRKNINRGRTVATMVAGSEALYKEVDKNPFVELHPIEYVNHPYVISKNDNMVSVLSIEEIDLSGLARVNVEEVGDIGSFPSSMDFINGARRSKNGFNIMAIPSTTADGERSRIVTESIRRGVAFIRSKVDFVVSEYGSVYLYGLSLRERTIALISIAHPKFRPQLLEEAQRLRYISTNHISVSLPAAGSVYPFQYECRHTFPTGLDVFFRPIQPGDARSLQILFYSLSPETIRLRYHGVITRLPFETAQRLANIDYSKDMAIVGVVGQHSNPVIIAEGRYTYNPENNMGDFDIVVHNDYRRHGIATFLANYLNKIAYTSGLSGVYADVIEWNAATIALLNKAWPTATKHFQSGSCTYTVRFPSDDVKRPKDSIFIYSGRFSDFSYGEEHPFKPDRARTTLKMIHRMGFMDEPWMRVEEPRLITKERLTESHTPDFVDALERANSGKWDESLLAYNLGVEDCPVFPGIFDFVLLYTSATLTGVDLIINENANVVFNPMGGFHHAGRSHAEGFCYVNDVIAAIDKFLAKGYRVAYIDIDAHHGNGVQDAYYMDDRVLVVSLHESGQSLYPWGGFENEIGEGVGRGYNINIPLPPETDDEAYQWVFDRVIPKVLALFSPTVVVALVGADAHKNDPLSHLCLTNNAMVDVLGKIRSFSNHLLMLGGGGYDARTAYSAWCRMWAAANRIDSMPDYLLTLGGTFFGGGGIKGADIVDMAYCISGAKKADILDKLNQIVGYHESESIPILEQNSRES